MEELKSIFSATHTWVSVVLVIPLAALQAYEAGARRVPVSSMPQLAKTLGVSLEELFGEEAKPSRGGKRGPPSRLQQQIEAIAQLPKAKQQFVSQMLETVLAGH